MNQLANPLAENNANNEDGSSSSGILTEHMSPAPSDFSLSSQSYDPYDVDNYKILHAGAMLSCRGRNIVYLLAERSVTGMIGGRRRGATPREEEDKMEEEADEKQEDEQTKIASQMPGTSIIIGTPPNNTDNSQAYVCYLSPPPHTTNRQQQSPINEAATPVNNFSTAQMKKPKHTKLPQPPHNNNDNTPLLTRLTSHIEYSSATRFKASYLKHLGGNPTERVPTSPHVPNQRGMTREQLETQELLRQHLRQEGRDLPGRDFPRRMLNPLQRRDNPGAAPAGNGGRFANLPSQRAPNPNPSVSTISISFSPDGRTLASTHGDHTVKITCAHTGSLIRNLEGHPRTPWTVKYHPTNNRIVASGCLGFQVRVWDWNYRTESVRRSYRWDKEKRYGGRYCKQVESEFARSFSPRGVMDPAFKGKKKEYKEEEDDDYAVAVLEEMGIPPTDPAWYDVLSESYNYHDGIGVCLNMIRLNHAIISLAFHPSGEILAVASGSTLHLWDYDEEGRRRKKKRKESLNAGGQPQRESESRILYRDRNSDFPASRTVDLRHESALRCVHFPPCGKTLIIGGVNPQSANEGLVHRHPRGRGGMSGGGMSFHLRLWDFDLEAILDADGGSSNMGGSVTDEGEVTWNIIGGKKALSDPRIIIPRVLLYNDGGFDLSQDGKVLSACAEYWLPEGIDSAMELLYSQQEMDDEKEKTPTPQPAQDNRPTSPSVEGTGLSYTSPSPIRPSFSILSDPRTPPPNYTFTSLEPPPPPGNRNLPRVYNPNNQDGSGSNLINAAHNPHPLSMVAPSHPAYESDGGRYVPHIVTISMDTSPPIKDREFKIDLTRSIIEMESMRRHPKLGQLLNASPLDGTKASGVTCVKLSPSAEYCLLGYGVRENLPSVDGNDPRHPVTALYNVNKGMVHVSTLTSIEDDVNIARFHPESGHGFVYGTKQGRVRVLSTRPWNVYEK